VTFRLDDWGRVDAQGNPRQMHLEQGEAASRADLRPEAIEPVSLAGGRVLLTACRYFALEKVSLRPGGRLSLRNDQSPEVVTLLAGSVSIAGGSDHVELVPGSSGVVWPSSDSSILVASGESVMLRAWVPDLAADIVEPARAAGASDEHIVALGGMTLDLAQVIG
jgi:mannose-6-phosphate isomerase